MDPIDFDKDVLDVIPPPVEEAGGHVTLLTDGLIYRCGTCGEEWNLRTTGMAVEMAVTIQNVRLHCTQDHKASTISIQEYWELPPKE